VRRSKLPYVVYIKDNIGNMVNAIDQDLPKQFTVQTLQITDGMMVVNSYRFPIEHILFIKEV